MSNFGGWAINEETFNWIINNIPKNSTILELGSGTGTIELSKYYNIYSIEHNQDFLNLCKDSNYIFCNIINGFYDINSIVNKLPNNYDLLLIDGPPKKVSNRYNFIKNIKHFNLKTNILVDDVDRINELNLLKKLSGITNKKYKIFGKKDKCFGVILN